MTDVGKVYGRLTITRIIKAADTPSKRTLAVCDCQCGTKGKIIPLRYLRGKNTNSCGCFRREKLIARVGSQKRSQGPVVARMINRLSEPDELDDILGRE